MKPEFDRWVLPPAVAAAVFSVMAAAPPGGSLREGLRIEGAQVGSSGPWLLRAAWEHPDAGTLRAPSQVRFTSSGHFVIAHGLRGAMYAWASLDAGALRARGVMTVRADDHSVRVDLAPHDRAPMPPPTSRAASSLDVVVEGGALITEEPGVVLVRARGATAVRVESDMDGVTVTPPRAEVDGCSVARFEASVEALGAPVRLIAEGSGASTSLRLPLQPGGLWTQWRDGAIEVRSAMAAGSVFVAGGTRDGITVWNELPWVRDGERAIARWAPPAGVTWALASSVPNFAQPSGGAREAFTASEACANGASSPRWFAAIERLPTIPEPEVFYDGVARGRARLAARKTQVRVFGFVGLALCVVAEAALVLGAGLSSDPLELREVYENRRKRTGLLAATVLTIAVAGLAFAVSGMVRVGE